MTEVPIEVGYRSYIRLLRKKWDIVYHSKDLYFSHANKILEPYYDMDTKEFYGIETNPTRLAIIKFIDQFQQGAGLYDVNSFPDLLKYSKNYAKRVKSRKPYTNGKYQESNMSLLNASREKHYELQKIKPRVHEVRNNFPYMRTVRVTNHPYRKMIGRTWAHIFLPSPVDFSLLADSHVSNCHCRPRFDYDTCLLDACGKGHDIIIVEPIYSQFYICLMLQLFSSAKWALKIMYVISIMSSCHRPHRWEWNLFAFLGISLTHVAIRTWLGAHPLAKYRLPDRFHDIECLNELKYCREFLPTIIHKVKVLFKDDVKEIQQPLRTIGILHLTNSFVLGYNYLFGIDHWYTDYKSY